MSNHFDMADAAMRGKYAPLYRHLCGLSSDVWHTNSKELEKILGFSLPKSARDYQAWWANETEGTHSHARAWLAAGWKVSDANPSRGQVTFKRGSP